MGRALGLSRRGVRVLVVDRERTLPEALADLSFALGFLLWGYETLAFALSLDAHLVPAWAGAVLLDHRVADAAGVLGLVAGLVIYALALAGFGSSWRLGIDREHPGELVTSGIFGRSRNPIYLALLLLALGSFLVLGRLVLGLLVIAFAVYLRQLVRREERFLAQRYGARYRDYAARVGRWWTWRR